MSAQVYLGIDLGAESGRVMAGLWDGATMRIEELHRFPNVPVEIAGTLRWDVLRLWAEIEHGLARAAQRFGAQIVSIGVDTWGVDYVLLSRSGELLGLPYYYRDPRTRGVMEAACERFGRAEIFAASGVQFMPINTLYQLIAARRDHPEILDAADCFLMIPDFFHWCLTGVRCVEFTNATTTQCFDPRQRAWSRALLDAFEIPARIFPQIVEPGSRLGGLRDRRGTIPVLRCRRRPHRTPPRVWGYIGSGTWSLLGLEVPQAILRARAAQQRHQRGRPDGTYRLLKNIMAFGSCMQARLDRGPERDYAIRAPAAEAAPFHSLIDPDDPRFAPPDYPGDPDFCRETGRAVHQTNAPAVLPDSLKYRDARLMEELSGERVSHTSLAAARNAL